VNGTECDTVDDADGGGPLSHSRIVLRPVGTPLPLGFLGLMVATTGFSAVQLGWIPATEGRVIAVAVLLFTVPVQLLASVFGFLARDPAAGTGMGLLAGTWGALAAITVTSPPGTHPAALGVVLLTAATAMVVPASVASGKLVAAAVMAMSALRFATTGIYEITASPGWGTAAGIVGLVLAVGAFYAALGFEWEGARRRTVLPLLRSGSGRSALHADFASQISNVAHEAGVRRQL